MPAPNLWDAESLEARMEDPARRIRHPAASPDAAEIEAYAAALPPDSETGTALVLGMTPELRRLAVARFRHTVVLDASSSAIGVYRDWLSAEERWRETVVLANWFDAPAVIGERVTAILGDGVFGNLPDVEAHRQLLRVLGSLLTPNGLLLTRMVFIPEGFVPADYAVARLLQQHRAGVLDEAEFGFGVRLLGHHGCCYDPRTHVLDSRKVFAECHAAWRKDALTDAEHRSIRRYYFAGRNCILPQALWEQLLTEAGFHFRAHRLTGKSWYAYYQVYEAGLG